MKITKDLEKMKKVKINQAGFSLIEVVFSMMIFLMITGTIYGLLEIGRTDRNAASNRSDTLKNARASMYLISRDLMNAGLGFHKSGGFVPNGFLQNKMDTPNDNNPSRDLLTSVCLGNDVNTNIIGGSVGTDSIAFAYRNLEFNNNAAIQTIDEISTNQNQITLKTTPGLVSLVNTHDLFIAETDTTQVMLMVTAKDNASNTITFAFGDPLGINQVRSGGATDKFNSLLRKCNTGETENCTSYNTTLKIGARLKKISWIKYKIDENGTLVRVLYGNNTGASAANQIQTQSLIYGVKNMQFIYVLNNGAVTDDPVKGPDGIRGTTDDLPSDVNLIRQVSIDLTIAAESRDARTNNKEIVSLNSTFSTRNLQYDDR
jgi:prepilin-type N-terminal cleavage/methylation domain-containing protein